MGVGRTSRPTGVFKTKEPEAFTTLSPTFATKNSGVSLVFTAIKGLRGKGARLLVSDRSIRVGPVIGRNASFRGDITGRMMELYGREGIGPRSFNNSVSTSNKVVFGTVTRR